MFEAFYSCFAVTKWAVTWQNQQSECAPSEDSDQPGHPPSLIRVFAVRMKKHCVLSYPSSTQRRLWSDWWMPRLIWVFPGRTLILYVLSCGWNEFLCITVSVKKYLNVQLNRDVQDLYLELSQSWENFSSGICDQVKLRTDLHSYRD